MTTLTKEQIEQKLQQLKQLTEEANAIAKELVEAGVIELSEDDLDEVAGGFRYGFARIQEKEAEVGFRQSFLLQLWCAAIQSACLEKRELPSSDY